MAEEMKRASRRTVVIGAAALAASPLLVPAVATAGVVTQANAKYQAQPKGAAHCAICKYFLPGANPTANGQCKQVAGAISPNGWCQFYAKKAS
jgi:hypothetical protein